jgi:hypothetical protein
MRIAVFSDTHGNGRDMWEVAVRFRIFRKNRNGDWDLLAELRQDQIGPDR